jgi:hypothetical protein
MSTVHKIKVHVDRGIFDGMLDAACADERATLQQYCESVYTSLARYYPGALVQVTSSLRTSGAGSVEILESEDSAVWDSRVTDTVRDLIHEAFERGDWVVRQ